MVLDIFLILVIISSFFFLAKIIFSKFLFLSKIDISQINQEEQRKVKINLFKKKFFEQLKKINLKKLFIDSFQKKFKKIKERLIELENRYLEKQKEMIKKKPLFLEKRVEKLFKEGNKLLAEKNFVQAEKKFTEIISFDPRNIETLRILGKIYLEQKKYEEGKEVFEYILDLSKQAIKWWLKFRKKEEENLPSQLIKELVKSLLDLGNFYRIIEKKEEAFLCFENVLEFEPNNPKILDFLIEFSIILNKKEEAKEYLSKLKEVNPQNQIITEWEERIKNL